MCIHFTHAMRQIMIMIRTQIYITVQLKKRLDDLSESRGSSKAEIIREALEIYCASVDESERKSKLQKAAGMWKNRTGIPDLKKLRSEFEREF
jgi:predicted DNA-binding protein